MRMIYAFCLIALSVGVASAQQPQQQQVTPSQVAVSIDDNLSNAMRDMHALARAAEQSGQLAQALNAQVTALTKERDDLKKQLEAMKPQAPEVSKP